jgi:hypothetical protein
MSSSPSQRVPSPSPCPIAAHMTPPSYLCTLRFSLAHLRGFTILQTVLTRISILVLVEPLQQSAVPYAHRHVGANPPTARLNGLCSRLQQQAVQRRQTAAADTSAVTSPKPFYRGETLLTLQSPSPILTELRRAVSSNGLLAMAVEASSPAEADLVSPLRTLQQCLLKSNKTSQRPRSLYRSRQSQMQLYR